MIWDDGTSRNRPLSSKTVHHAFALLKGAFAWAVRMQLAAVNPLAAVDPPKVIRREAEAFAADDIHNLLLTADGTRWQNLIAFALATGARRGELAALRWNAIDLEARTATIRASLSDTKSGVVEKTTKTERPRVVPLSIMAIDALKRERLVQEQAKRWSRAPYSDSGHVFQGPLGGHVRPYEITDGFRKLARKAGIATTSFHALRHTAATWMLVGGVDARTAAGVLGHSTPSTTLGIYAHVIASAQAAAVTTIEDRLRKVGG
ncbi:MAG TPA: site-specific integrase [Candidatus Rubrimentiphilum sp.]|nr:site-specific integrase [Candidatus Rubrimentiphilum sp.]